MGRAGLHALVQVADEGACASEARLHLLGCLQCGAAAGHQLFGLQGRQVVQRLWPVLKVRVARIRRGVELHQVAAEQNLLLRQPGHRVALGVAPAQLQDLHFELAQPQSHLLVEGHRGPGQAVGHALHVLEQARKAADLAVLVELAALHDQVTRVLAGDDVLSPVGAGAQHAHGVVVG
ncbi:hypothetical protein D3C71_1656730 [compost metagenome]